GPRGDLGHVHGAARRGRCDVRPDAVGARGGRHGGHRRSVDWQAAVTRARRLRIALYATLACNALWLVLVALVYAAPLPARTTAWSTAVGYGDGRPEHVFLGGEGVWWLPVTLGRVGPAYVAALFALEDKGFYSHTGVDPVAI